MFPDSLATPVRGNFAVTLRSMPIKGPLRWKRGILAALGLANYASMAGLMDEPKIGVVESSCGKGT